MKRAEVSLAMLVVLLWPLGACSNGQMACPNIACPDGIHVRVADHVVPPDEPVAVEACAGLCKQEDFPPPDERHGPIEMTVADRLSEPGVPWDVEVTVTSKDGDVVVAHEERVIVEREWVAGLKHCASCVAGHVEVDEAAADR